MAIDFRLFFDPVILAILAFFFAITGYLVYRVLYINSSLTKLTKILKGFKKGSIVYRFKELDEAFSKEPFIASYWVEFKNSLVFNEGMAVKSGEDPLKFQNIAPDTSNIQCTIDSGYFFNEETLVNGKMNYKFISAVPTILTGLGPLFTFLHISLAFAKVNFATQEATITSVSALMAAMKVAAMISVVAVGTSIIFMVIERLIYKNLCIVPLNEFQLELNKLFDNISSEKFLVELLKESKLQNSSMNQVFNDLPDKMKVAFESSFNASLIPYLDNLIFSVNKLQETITKGSKGSTSLLNDLFGGNTEAGDK